jgi:hypothetical protein
MGAKRSCMHSFELQTLSPPLFLDVDLEGPLNPLNFLLLQRMGMHIILRNKRKLRFIMWIKSLGFKNAMGR